MSESEDEYWRLLSTVERIQSVVANGMASHAASNLLLAFLDNAQKRLGQLEQEDLLTPEEEKRRKAERDAVAVRYLVEKETALNPVEQQQYSIFLEREFFTKSDFGELETFYTKSWDKLSDGGKAQMSNRVWEGVRQDEYLFSELPETVKKKEAERIHAMLTGATRAPEELKKIPDNDKRDFKNAWEDGRRSDSYEVLDRPSFKENVSVSSKEVSSENLAHQHKGDQCELAASQVEREQSGFPSKPVHEAELSDGLLGELNAPPKDKALQALRERPAR